MASRFKTDITKEQLDQMHSSAKAMREQIKTLSGLLVGTDKWITMGRPAMEAGLKSYENHEKTVMKVHYG